MNWRAIWAIVRKDLKVVLQNKGVSIPIIVVPLVMLVLLPALIGFAPALGSTAPGSPLEDLRLFLDRMPAALQNQLAGYDELQSVVVLGLVYLLAPFFLIVPLMVASVIAADSFAGEKERKTLEALLYTPTSDRELLTGKFLAAWLPAVAVAVLGFVLYATVANIAAWPLIGEVLLPNLMWMLLVFWVAPAVAATGLAVSVIISARAQGFQDAYQLSAIVVLPVIMLVVAQATGVMYFSTLLVAALGAALWLLSAVLLWWGARNFRRGDILSLR